MKLKEVRYFLYCDYWACSHKTTYILPKRSPSYPCIFSLHFSVKHAFVVLFPSLGFCLTAPVAPPLLCLCCWPWAVRCQSLASGFLHETSCLPGPMHGSSPQNLTSVLYIGWYAVSGCIYCECYILGSLRQRIHIETRGRGEVCLPVIFSSTGKSIRTKADVH